MTALSPSAAKASYFVPCIVHIFWNTERSTSVRVFVKLYIINLRTLNEIRIFKIWFEQLLAGYERLYNRFAVGLWLVLVLSDDCLKTEHVGDDFSCELHGRTTEQQYSIITSSVSCIFVTKRRDSVEQYSTVFFTTWRCNCSVCFCGFWIFSIVFLPN